MKQIYYLGVILYIVLSVNLFAAGVSAELSQQEVVAGNPAQLLIRAEGDRVNFPPIKEIDGVRVEGRSQSQHTSMQIINGKSSVTHTTNLILTFTPTRDMQIPSFDVEIDGKHYQTQPLVLKVVKVDTPQRLTKGAFSLMMKANPKHVVVGEPLVVKVYFSLRNDIQLSDNPQYNRPEFKGFLVKEVGEQKHYVKGDHQITELRYVLIPEKEGHFTIGPATAKIGVPDTSKRDIFGRFFGTIWKPIASNRVDIEVDPLPQASDLVGSFYVESQLDKQETKANKPVNLTITISGNGSLEDFDLSDYEIDGVTVYGDDAQVSSKIMGSKLQSRYVKKFVFISDHDFTIPERTITAYDPKSKQLKQLTIPSYEVHVTQSKQQPALTVSNEKKSGSVQTDITLPSDTQHPRSESVVKKDKDSTLDRSMVWAVALLEFIAGMVTMFLLSKLTRRERKQHFRTSDALKILYAHMSEDPEVEAMVRKLYAKQKGDKSVIIDKKALKALVEKYRMP